MKSTIDKEIRIPLERKRKRMSRPHEKEGAKGWEGRYGGALLREGDREKGHIHKDITNEVLSSFETQGVIQSKQ